MKMKVRTTADALAHILKNAEELTLEHLAAVAAVCNLRTHESCRHMLVIQTVETVEAENRRKRNILDGGAE